MEPLVLVGGNENLLAELNKHGVRFIVVGGVAVWFYARERGGADDVDLLIESSAENANRCFEALPALNVRLSMKG
jgi:predicted nucleotidyltransferase